MGNGIVVAGNLHLLPVILGEDVMLASVFAFHFHEAIGGGGVVGDVDKDHALIFQLVLHLSISLIPRLQGPHHVAQKSMNTTLPG